MTKKVKISLLILVWSIVAVQIYVNKWEYSKHEAVTAFSVVEDDVRKESVQGYGYFGTMDLSEQSKKEMLQKLACKLGITDGFIVDSEEGEDYKKTTLKKTGKYADTILQIISLPGKTEEEQYIVIDIQMQADVLNAFATYKKIKRVYEEIGTSAQVHFEIQMEKQGDCTSKRDAIVKSILKTMKAEQKDAICENDIYTVYGYTRLEDSFLTLNKKKINMQVVMNYEEEEDKTIVKIGMPIVNSSY